MPYQIKTLSQLPMLLKGFRKAKGLTQAAMAEKLGITQQSYSSFEANPTTATLERLFTALRLLDVEISLDQAQPYIKHAVVVDSSMSLAQSTKTQQTINKMNILNVHTPGKAVDTSKQNKRPSAPPKLTGKKESW